MRLPARARAGLKDCCITAWGNVLRDGAPTKDQNSDFLVSPMFECVFRLPCCSLLYNMELSSSLPLLSHIDSGNDPATSCVHAHRRPQGIQYHHLNRGASGPQGTRRTHQDPKRWRGKRDPLEHMGQLHAVLGGMMAAGERRLDSTSIIFTRTRAGIGCHAVEEEKKEQKSNNNERKG